MPHGNRVSSSSALKMTGIWTNTIGYDPYAAEGGGPDAEDEANAFEQAQGLMALAKLSNQGVSNLFCRRRASTRGSLGCASVTTLLA